MQGLCYALDLQSSVYGGMMKTTWKTFMDSLDQQRQAPAVRESRNAVVAAGAGSGKTRVLSMRYLYLVKDQGISPSRIMCLTFTRKAAAEMRSRIRSMLLSASKDDAVFGAALESFADSKVGTLDSFCSELARNSCARWGVAPDFEVDDQSASESTYQTAMEYLLETRNREFASQFIAWNGFESALDALSTIANEKGGVFGAADAWINPDEAGHAMARLMKTLSGQLAQMLQEGLSYDAGATKGGLAWQDHSQKYGPVFEAFDPLDPQSLAKAREGWTAIRPERKPASNSKASGPLYYNQCADSVKKRIDILRLADAALSDGRRKDLHEFVCEFLSRAAKKRAAANVLGFSDIAWMARRALLDDLELRSWYKKHYDAIMIDEFQDNNELQKDILYLLAERRDLEGVSGRVPVAADLREGALFFVGDEKQSIYAFRGADVSVFRGLGRELASASGGLGKHSLSVNWRSEPALISFFNETFGRIMPSPDDQSAQPYEARFEPLGCGPATPGVEACVQYLEVPLPEQDGLKSETAQAIEIAKLVRSLVDAGVPVCSNDSGGKSARPCRWEDIAVLYRSTKKQNELERCFRLLGIPYSASAVGGLFSESVIGDLYVALRLAALPDDRAAFASYLRGPFARLSDRAVVTILAIEPGSDGTYPPAFSQKPLGLDETDSARWQEAFVTWSSLRNRADREPLCNLVSYLWHERGLRWNVLSSAGSEAYLEHFDYAWSLAADADKRFLRLSDLVAEMEPLMGGDDKLDDISVLRESARGVAIMSVHKSKGLEFPIVILPDCQNTGRSDVSEALVAGRRFGLSAKLPDTEGTLCNPQAALEKELDNLDRSDGVSDMDPRLAETARLFYVACTRAICRLYLVGTPPYHADTRGNSFRGLLLKAYPWVGQPSRKTIIDVPDAPPDAPLSLVRCEPMQASEAYGFSRQQAKVKKPAYLDKAETWAPQAKKIRLAVTAASKLIQAHVSETYSASSVQASLRPEETAASRPDREGFSETDFGTLCHEFVQAMLHDPEREPQASGQSAKRLAAVSASVRDTLLAQARLMAHGFLASHLGLASLQASKHSSKSEKSFMYTEYQFVYRAHSNSQTRYLSGAMDLVFCDGSGVTVVDFKTDKLEEPDHHSFQLGLYRIAAESMFGMPARAYLYYLPSAHAIQVDTEPDFDALFQA